MRVTPSTSFEFPQLCESRNCQDSQKCWYIPCWFVPQSAQLAACGVRAYHTIGSFSDELPVCETTCRSPKERRSHETIKRPDDHCVRVRDEDVKEKPGTKRGFISSSVSSLKINIYPMAQNPIRIIKAPIF